MVSPLSFGRRAPGRCNLCYRDIRCCYPDLKFYPKLARCNYFDLHSSSWFYTGHIDSFRNDFCLIFNGLASNKKFFITYLRRVSLAGVSFNIIYHGDRGNVTLGIYLDLISSHNKGRKINILRFVRDPSEGSNYLYLRQQLFEIPTPGEFQKVKPFLKKRGFSHQEILLVESLVVFDRMSPTNKGPRYLTACSRCTCKVLGESSCIHC